eukprot:2016738-Prorocentrum_lima.AAC.1
MLQTMVCCSNSTSGFRVAHSWSWQAARRMAGTNPWHHDEEEEDAIEDDAFTEAVVAREPV